MEGYASMSDHFHKHAPRAARQLPLGWLLEVCDARQVALSYQ